MAEPLPGRDQAEPSPYVRLEALRSATARTTWLRPLFPPRLADLEGTEVWMRVAEVVRRLTVEVVKGGQYPFEEFYTGDHDAEELVVARVSEAVFGALPPGSGVLEDVGDVVGELVRHRLTVTGADRAGRELAAPSPEFDLYAWAWRIQMSPIGKEPDDLLALSDKQLSYFVSRRQDAVVAEMTSRSRQRWLLGNFASDLDALRFVVMRIGADWRSAVGRRPVSAVRPAIGMNLEDGPTATHLTWSGGWADFPKGVAGRAGALSFSQVVTLSPAAIAALYETAR